MSDEILFLKKFTLILEAKWAFGFLHCFQCQEDLFFFFFTDTRKSILANHCNLLLNNSNFGGHLNEV